MKPVVDKNLCISCGTCVALCPNNFQLGADGKSEAVAKEGAESENVQMAIDSCPAKAITVTE